MLPEILALIFQHACPTIDLNQRYGLSDLPQPSPHSKEKRPQFILGAVSFHWRQVLFSTPRIWTSIDLFIGPGTLDRASAVLQAFFTYSGQLPLAIAICFPPSWTHNAKFLVDPSSDAVLHQNTHRIRELHLADMSDVWTNFLPSLSNLVNLSVKYTLREKRPLVVKNQCSHLTLTSLSHNPQPSCSELTVLRMDEIPVDICLEVLLKCPNLIEYRNRAPVDAKGWILVLPQEPFVLPYLETFEWSVNTDDDTDISMLQHIRMPVLRKLIWVEENLKVTDPRDIFFHNLPPTLIDFHFHNAQINLNHPRSVFDIVCDSFNVERLTFDDIGSLFLNHVLERLTLPLNIAENQQARKLNKLKDIIFREVDWSDSQRNEDKILRMLGHRLLNADALNPEPLRLQLPFHVTLSPQFKERFKDMIGRGLKVEIFEGLKPLDWS